MTTCAPRRKYTLYPRAVYDKRAKYVGSLGLSYRERKKWVCSTFYGSAIRIGKSNGLFHRWRAPALSPTPRHREPPSSPPPGGGWPYGLGLRDRQPALGLLGGLIQRAYNAGGAAEGRRRRRGHTMGQRARARDGGTRVRACKTQDRPPSHTTGRAGGTPQAQDETRAV